MTYFKDHHTERENTLSHQKWSSISLECQFIKQSFFSSLCLPVINSLRNNMSMKVRLVGKALMSFLDKLSKLIKDMKRDATQLRRVLLHQFQRTAFMISAANMFSPECQRPLTEDLCMIHTRRQPIPDT